MTVERGEHWGEPTTDAPEIVAASDAELALAARQAIEDGRRLTAGVGRGDLLRTLGLDRPRVVGERHAFPLDLGLAVLDGADQPVPFVSHVVARRRLWSGPLLVAMNVAWLGDLRLGPRAHPNDGLLDITVGRLPISERPEARRRARSGSHLPHPALRTARTTSWEEAFASATPVMIDGVRHGRVEAIRLDIVPDALVVVA